MRPDDDTVNAVEGWFRTNFPDHSIESGKDFDRMLMLFRAFRPKSTPHELEISYEAFQDHDTAIILGDLDRLQAARELRDRPNVRFMYNRHRQLVETDRHS